MPITPPAPVSPGASAKPTPTQAENDAARIGNNVTNKTADGSPKDPYVDWWVNGPSGDTKEKPFIETIAPTTGAAGTVVLIVTGQNFTDDLKIVFAGVQQTSSVNTPKTQVTATIPGVTAGAKTVLVRNSVGDSNSKTFTAS